MGKKIVIVGAVAAGPKAACRARRLMPEAEITIIDQDTLISYGGCGIPYYVSGEVPDEKELRSTSFHMTRDERFFQEAKGLAIRSGTRAVSIDRAKKILNVEDVQTGHTDALPYDKLVLATGSRPFMPPIPGNDLDGVFTISDLHKAIEIKERLSRGEVGKVVIIGGGAIGIEMAEAFVDLWGIEASIVEFMPQVLPRIVSRTIAAMVEGELRKHGVTVYTNEAARQFVGEGGRIRKVVTNRRELEADLVVVAAGVRPRGELARDAGLLVSPQGAIVVNQRMQTSDPDIYAAGDCVETLHLVSGKKAYAPMGSIANRQGRVVADNLAGIPSVFAGAVGSFIMKVFDACVGATGLSPETARMEGFDAAEALGTQSDRAHFFPTYALMFLSLVVDRRTRRVLGLSGFGAMGDGLMARINAVASLLETGRPTISDLSTLELAYAPPFSTAVDILNATANTADNLVSGRLRTITPEEFISWIRGKTDHPDWMAVDLRHPKEAALFVERFPDRWMALPYDTVRSNQEKLPGDRHLVLICNAGTRSYEIQCFLDSIGMVDSSVLPGGLNVVKRMDPSWMP